MYRFIILLILFLPMQATANWEIQPECKALIPEGFNERKISPANPEDWKFLRCQAENGDISQQHYIGLSLLHLNRHSPEGYKPEEGLHWIIKAASTGDHNAQRTLAWIYSRGIKDFLEKDFNRAYQWRYLMVNNKRSPFRENSLVMIREAIPAEMRASLEDGAYDLLKQKE